VFRSQSSSDFYRVSLRCDGQIRLELIQGTAVVPLSVVESSGALLPGPLQQIRVALWLYGREVRAYVNDVFMFSENRLRWQTGGLGVFARTGTGKALTVNFSDLEMRESSAFPPTPFPTMTPEPIATATPLRRP
jgi:hypothetical protein